MQWNLRATMRIEFVWSFYYSHSNVNLVHSFDRYPRSTDHIVLVEFYYLPTFCALRNDEKKSESNE